jgi:hypothetical protein
MLKRSHRHNAQFPVGALIAKLAFKVGVHVVKTVWEKHKAKREAEDARRRDSKWPPPSGAAVPA